MKLMKLTILLLSLVVSNVASSKPVVTVKENPSKTPTIVYHIQEEDGAKIGVSNPTKKDILVKFNCPNAFSVDWNDVPKRSIRKVVIKASETILAPCELIWKNK